MLHMGKPYLPTMSSGDVGALKVGSGYTSSMANMIETLGERLRYGREAARLTQSDVAAEFGISRVSVLQWEKDETKPSPDKLPILATLYNTTTDWLLSRIGNPPLVVPNAKIKAKADKVPPALPGEDLVGAKDLPIFAAAMGGDGHTIITLDPVDWVKRPAVLQNVRGGYGIIIVSTSMIPAYWPGDTALVHPHLPPARDTDVILYHTPPDGREAEAIIKRLVGMNDREWTLEQYQPARQFRESRADWPVCHRVVGKYNAR